MTKAIVVGASSGIGRALASEFARNGYAVGLVGRRVELLEEVAGEIQTNAFVKQIDVTEAENATQLLMELIDEMSGADVIVINAGVMFPEPDLEAVAATIAVNVLGFATMAEAAMNYFCGRGSGHIVGISSVAALRGARRSSVYNASKAFVSNYLDGLRHRIAKTECKVHVTDIKPGSVATKMTEGKKGLFGAASPEVAAKQIFDAIRKKKRHAYVTKKWRLISWLIRALPDRIYHKA
jgi:short-subunit dehydrogenase